MPNSKPPYPPEFRREALELLRLSEKPITQIAKDLGVSEQTLYVWRRQAEMPKSSRSRGEPCGWRDRSGRCILT